MFKGLKNHSTLYVLHHSTPLGVLDPLEVVDILKMRPRIPSRSSLLSPPPQFSRGTTPMKLISSEAKASPAPSPLGAPPSQRRYSTTLKQTVLKPEQERDIAIFRSFCAMKLILDAVWCAVQIRNGVIPITAPTNTRESAETEVGLKEGGVGVVGGGAGNTSEKPAGKRAQRRCPVKAARKLELGSEDLASVVEDAGLADIAPELEEEEEEVEEEVVVDMEKVLSHHYQRGVVERLQEARVYLASIFPLNYRLEVLEDIFSLLMLTSDDLKVKALKQPFTSSPNHGSLKNMSALLALMKSKHEFLMDERLASELLDILQDCIHALRAAKYGMSQQPDAGERSALSASTIKCSVSDVTLKSRTAKLEQYVNEARWRLQMVSTKQAGIVAVGVKGEALGGGSCFSSSESDTPSCCSESDEGESDVVEKRMKRKRSGHVTAADTKMDDGSGSVGSFSSLKVEHFTSSTNRLSSKRPSPSPAPSPSVLSSSQPAPRPASFSPHAAGSHSHSQASPKPKRSVSSQNQNSTSSVGGRKVSSDSSKVSLLAPLPAQHRRGHLEDDSGDADVEERSPVGKSRRRKLLKSRDAHMTRKRHLHLLLPEQSQPRASRSSIVCWMLASAGSLLRMCLKHGDYMRASEVLKTLHMEGQFGEALIKFSEQYEAVSKQLVQHSRSNTPRIGRSSASASTTLSSPHSTHLSHSNTSPAPPPVAMPPVPSTTTTSSSSHGPGEASSSSSLNMNLQVAILNAKSCFDPLQCVHQLLAPSSVHRVLFSGDDKLEGMAEESELLRVLMKHIPSLVMLDLVCANKISGHVATKLLESALDRLQSDPPSSTLKDVANGPLVLLRLMANISAHFPQTLSFTHTHTLVPPPHISPHSLLTASSHVLTSSAAAQVRIFRDIYRESRERLEVEIDVSRQELSRTSSKSPDIFNQLSQLASGLGEGSPSPSTPTSPLRLKTGNIFDELVRALHSVPLEHIVRPTSREGSVLPQPAGPTIQSNTGRSFLWKFSRYIVRLIELIIKCLAVNTPSENNKHVHFTTIIS